MTGAGREPERRPAPTVGPGPGSPRPTDSRDVALVDVLDRLLAGGVVLAGDVTISLAGVDLVRISVRALLVSITSVDRPEPRS